VTDVEALLPPLREQRVLPVLRLPTARDAAAAAGSMLAAGLRVVELTATTPGWEQALVDTQRGAPADAVLGLGTVTDAEVARRAVQSGARFLVSPWPAPQVREVAGAAGVAFIEGAFSPGEVAAGVARGPVKIFPAHVGGPSYITDLARVLPAAVLVPTGGIALEEVTDWLQAGAAAVGLGSALLQPGAVQRLAEMLAAVPHGTGATA
jgi:2-dehydro-3-deoxyphosphogluconate aldolase/(4S)-4-hydroxy-2-oxoglutarate aldolase